MRLILSLLVFVVVAGQCCLASGDNKSLKRKESAQIQRNDSVMAKAATLPYKVKLKYANALYEIGNYYDAMDVYLDLTNEKPDNNYLYYMLGECNYHARDYQTAEKWYAKVVEKGADDFPLAYYWYAQMLKMNGKYEEAKYTFAKFTLRADEEYKAKATREIAACDYAIKETESVKKFVVIHLDSSINTPFSEYAPYVRDSILYYSSLNHQDTMTEEGYLSHIYRSVKVDSVWTDGKLMPDPINDNKMHSGNTAFSPDGKRMYFTKCSDEGAANIKCKIYMTIQSEEGWSKPVKLSEGVNDAKFNNTHPAIAKGDGSFDILYFSSDRTGGYGGYDIWYCEVSSNGVSTPPVNCGGNINTPDDEYTPFYRKGHLYFSSTGHIGLGGFDVFIAAGRKNNWTAPGNLGYPLNSRVDDIYFTKGHEPRTYYLVSNRPGVFANRSETCCDDIFKIIDLRVPKFAIKGQVFEDTAATIPVIGSKMEVFDVTGKERVPVQEEYLVGESKYSVKIDWDREYLFKFQKKGHFSEIFNISTVGLFESDTFRRNVILEKIEKNKSYRLEKIYYEFGKAKLDSDSKESLDLLYELLVENPKIVLEVSSHTDSVGSASYNLDLSQQRAQACVDYLIKKGIEDRRLIPKGYGEARPIVPNSNPDGSDNEVGRQLNRRTEIKIIGELSRKGDKIIYD